MYSIPYRIVRHELPQGSCHLDLFLLVYGKELLYSYEIDTHFEMNFVQKKAKNIESEYGEVSLWGKPVEQIQDDSQARTIVLCLDKPPVVPVSPAREGHPLLWRAKPKAKHRLRYWNYSGPISAQRGLIKGLGYGKFFCDPEEFDFF